MNQPTANPTRKMWAVIITGVIMSVILPLVQQFAPEFAPLIPQVEPWVVAAVMCVMGYMVPERA